jgi:hypothetical protein
MFKRLILFATASLILTSCTSVSDATHPQVAASLRAVSAVLLTGVVNSDVINPPSVIVLDADANPIPGVAVHFSVEGGSVRGADVTTDRSGVATLESWTLPTKVGTSLVTATSGILPPIAFTATTVAGPPAQIRKMGGDNQYGAGGSLLRFVPQVAVTDAFGNPVSGLGVTFTVESGGGSITGPSAVTDNNGLASIGGWTLGPFGAQVISARTSTLGPVTFSAIASATSNICAPLGELQAGVPLTSSLDGATCRGADGRYSESFVVRGAVGTGTRLYMESSKFNTVLEVRNATGDLIATNDDRNELDTNSLITILLPAEDFVLTATSARPNEAGEYKVSREIAGVGSNCGSTFITPGIDVNRTMTSDACGAGLPVATDRYRVFLKAGTPVKFEVLDRSYNGPLVQLLDGSNSVVAGEVVEQFYTHTVSFTSAYDGYFTLQVTGAGEELINYDLHVR